MTLDDLTLAYDFLRQKEQRLARVRSSNFGSFVEADAKFAKDEVDRAFQMFVEDLKQYVLEP